MYQHDRFWSRSALVCAVGGTALISGLAQAQETGSREAETADETWRVEEITVIGTSLQRPDTDAALPIQILAGDELARRRQGTLGETLEGLPGIHMDSFGGGASRPCLGRGRGAGAGAVKTGGRHGGAGLGG